MWPVNGREKRNLAYYLRYLYPRIQPIRMVYGVLCQMINISIVWGDTTRIVEYISALVFQVVILIRFVTLFSKREKIKDMCDTIDRLNNPKMLVDENMEKIVSRTQWLSKLVTITCFILTTVLMSAFLVIILIQSLLTRNIPLRLWYPYDIKLTPLFEMTTIFTFVTMGIESFVVNLSNTLFTTLMIQTIGQFKLLSYKLQHIRKLADEKVKRNILRRKHLSNIAHALRTGGETQSSARSEGAVETGSLGWTELVLDIPGCVQRSAHSEDIGEEWSEESKEESPIIEVLSTGVSRTVATTLEMERVIKGCAIHHQVSLGLVNDLQLSFKFMLIQQITFNAMGSFLVLYITTLAPSIDATVIVFMSAVFGFYGEFFLFCWVGQKITDEGLKVRDAIYDCDWFGASERFKRIMRIMITRMNKPLVIKAAGLPLSVGTCRLICRASYYFHTVLSKMFHGETMMKNR